MFIAAVLLAPFSSALRAGDTAVYDDHEVSSHWSDPAITSATDGKEFHGMFGNQNVSLTLNRLPPHNWIRISFDLYIIGSWDGSSPVWGPDLWSMSVHGAQRLIFSSFCAWGYSGNDEQSYPDDFPHAIHPAWTGVLAREVVDIKDSDPPKNGLYKVEVCFPHTDDQVVLDFAGLFQDPPLEQQVWGLGNFQVSTSAEPVLTKADALPGLWEKLGGDGSVAANDALWQFVGAGDAAKDFIKEKVGQIRDSEAVSEADSLRLHRAHRIVRIIGGPGSSGLCFQMDHHFLEYARKYRGQ